MHRKHSLLLAAAFAALPAIAGDDFGLWTEVGVQKDFSKHFSIDASLEFRAQDKVSQASRWALNAGAAWKPCKYFTLGVGYAFIHDYFPQETKTDYKVDDDSGELEFNGYNVDHGYWRNKHRGIFDLTGKLPVGRFTFSLRERYQYTHHVATTINRTRYRSLIPASMIEAGGYSGDYEELEGQYFGTVKLVENEKRAKDTHNLKSRLQVEYNIRHCAWTPYASCELTNDLSDGLNHERTRYTLGAEWKISKKHRLDFAYLYEDGADDDDPGSNNHVISINYKFKF